MLIRLSRLFIYVLNWLCGSGRFVSCCRFVYGTRYTVHGAPQSIALLSLFSWTVFSAQLKLFYVLIKVYSALFRRQKRVFSAQCSGRSSRPPSCGCSLNFTSPPISSTIIPNEFAIYARVQ